MKIYLIFIVLLCSSVLAELPAPPASPTVQGTNLNSTQNGSGQVLSEEDSINMYYVLIIVVFILGMILLLIYIVRRYLNLKRSDY